MAPRKLQSSPQLQQALVGHHQAKEWPARGCLIFDEADSAPKPKKAKSAIPLEKGTLYVKYAARSTEDLHIPLQEGQAKLLVDHLATEEVSAKDAQPRAYNKSGKFEGAHGKYYASKK